MKDSLKYIISKIEEISNSKLRKLCKIVIKDKDFLDGFGAKSHHHNYKGGLLIHTAEVLKNVLSVNLGYLDKDILITSVVWHDYLKKKDYSVNEKDEIIYTDYASKIYHISGSWAEFYHQAKLIGIHEEIIEKIGHCLLSHHGRPEWGSAITPKTPEAVVLHWADCMSAWFENGKYKEKK